MGSSWLQYSTRVTVLTLVLLTLWTTSSLAATDQTLQEKATGKDVVEAVVSKIRKSGIFTDDYQFLRRVAYVESLDGEKNTTFTGGNNGGIWNVPAVWLTRTQGPNMTDYHQKINSTFNINWAQVLWADLLKPFYSGLAARLYLAYSNLVIPQTIAEQGIFYERYYNRKDENYTMAFINGTEELENKTETCSGKMDLVVVLDGSGSVNENDPNNFDLCKRFVADLIGSYSLRHVRHGFIVFSNEVFTIFPLDNFLTMPELKNKTLSAEYPNSKTNTNAAILAAVEMFKAAEPRFGVPKVMTIFTDGKSNPAGVENIEYAYNASISSYAIGITDEVDLSELEKLAYNITSNVFSLDNFEVLAQFFKQLNAETCKVPQKPELGQPVNDSLVQGERRFYELEFSVDGAVYVEIELSQGKASGYYSFSEPNPSSAVNDGVLKPEGTLVQPPLSWISKQTDGEDDETGKNETRRVFITVQGVEAENEYVIVADATPRDDSTTTTVEPETDSTSTTTVTVEPNTDSTSTENGPSSTDVSDGDGLTGSTQPGGSTTPEKESDTTPGSSAAFTVSFSFILFSAFLSCIATFTHI